ncbi:MAG: adenylate/guanylate cyclase domain-containing protein [Pseudomonadota bacterium]
MAAEQGPTASAKGALIRLGRRRWVQAVGGWISRLAEAGTAGYSGDVKRRLMILNMIAYLIAASTLGYAVQHATLDFATYEPVIYINLALVLMAVLVPFSHRFGDLAGGLIIVVSEYVALFAITAYLGRSSGVHLQYFIAAAATFVGFGLARLKLIIPIVLIGLALHLYAWFNFPRSLARVSADREVLDSLYVQAAITTVALTAASVYYAFRLAERAKAETDALLRNILPDSVVERLKAHPGEAIADSFAEASILFADISGFVALARRLGAERTVELLNRIVLEFDCLATGLGVEKIKTIGDAYMVAAGIPEPAPDHLHRLARMALAMQDVVAEIRRRSGIDVAIRIGIASGPVMAGVIGSRKFSYDVWGDAVNLAARLESASEPGRILVCPSCRQRIDADFDFERRGEIDIKGLGARETWYLVGEKRKPGGASDSVGISEALAKLP